MTACLSTEVRHPDWCSRQWCEQTAEGVDHRSDLTEWDTRGASFLASVMEDDQGNAVVSVAVTSRTAEPGVHDYTWCNLSPAELRETAGHLLELARVAEQGVTR